MLLPNIIRIFPVIHFSRKCTILVSMQRCTHAVRQKFGSSGNESNGPGVVEQGETLFERKEQRKGEKEEEAERSRWFELRGHVVRCHRSTSLPELVEADIPYLRSNA